MPIQCVNPPALFPSAQYGFSQIAVTSGRRQVFISGQTAWNEHQHIVGGTDLGAQTRQALRNVTTAVEAAGGTLANVGSLRIYFVANVANDVGAIGAALREYFPANPPASTWVGIACLARPEFLVEVEATAVLD